MGIEDQLNVTNFPQVSGEYKVVQLEVDGQPCLRFAEERDETHAVIIMVLAYKLERFPTPTMQSPLEKYEVPALESDWYKVLGMGVSRVDIEEKKALFFGASMGYGMGISADHLKAVSSVIPEWALEKVPS